MATIYLLGSAALFLLGCGFALRALDVLRQAQRALREAEGLRLTCASELRSIQADRRVAAERQRTPHWGSP